MRDSVLYGAIGRDKNVQLHEFRDQSNKPNIYVRNYMKSNERADLN